MGAGKNVLFQEPLLHGIWVYLDIYTLEQAAIEAEKSSKRLDRLMNEMLAGL